MYLAIEAQGGVYGGGMVYCIYFIVIMLFGNCKFFIDHYEKYVFMFYDCVFVVQRIRMIFR